MEEEDIPVVSESSSVSSTSSSSSVAPIDPVVVAASSARAEKEEDIDAAASYRNSRERKIHLKCAKEYKSFYKARIDAVKPVFEQTLGGRGAGSGLAVELNAAVRLGAPANFSEEEEITAYAIDRVEPRCRYLYNLIFTDSPVMRSMRSKLLPSVEGGAAAVKLVSVGGGPGFDHLTSKAGRATARNFKLANTLTINFVVMQRPP